MKPKIFWVAYNADDGEYCIYRRKPKLELFRAEDGCVAYYSWEGLVEHSLCEYLFEHTTGINLQKTPLKTLKVRLEIL